MNAIHSPGIGSTLDGERPTLEARIIVALGSAVCLTGYVAGSCMGGVSVCVPRVDTVGMCHPVFLVCVWFLGLVLWGLFLVCVVPCAYLLWWVVVWVVKHL